MTTNKLWIGSIPPQCAEDYVIQKLRSLSEGTYLNSFHELVLLLMHPPDMLCLGVVDVVVDMRVRQAIVVFSSTEGAQAALNRIKAGVPKQFVFKVESGEARVPADFCSDRLHDHFIDRKHGGIPVKTPAVLTATTTGGAGSFGVGTTPVAVDDSLTALLAPPPDPPSDMPSYRYEHHREQRRSPPHSRRRERSRERSQERSRHRKSKYDYDKGSSRKKERKERKPSASSDSSLSSSEDSSLTRLRSGSNDSRTSSPLSYSQRNKDRRRDERREIRNDRNINGKPRNSSSSRRSPLETPKWSDRKGSRHSPSASEERVPQTTASSGVNAPTGTATPTPDDRKSGDSGSSNHSQKRHSVDGQSSQHGRAHPSSVPQHRTRAGKWPWSELLRNPCIFSDFRLAEIGSRLTDVNASLEEAHRGVAELDDHHHRRPSISLATDTSSTPSRPRQAGVLGSTPRTDSFEERLRSINQKKKSSFDDFTLNITQERILAAKSSRKTGAPYSSTASTSRPPQSAPSTTASTPPVRLAAPPTAPVIAYPPNFSVPPPNFPVTPSSSAYAPSSTPDSQTSPILSAPPPPPQLPPAMQDSTSNRDATSLKSPTSTSGHCPSFKTSATSSSCGTRTTHANPHTTSSTSTHSSHHPHGVLTSLPSSSQTNPHSHSHTGSSHSQTTLKGPLATNKTPSTTQRTSNEKQFPPRHDSMSALKSPVSGTSSSLTGRSLSVSDSRKQATTPVAHKRRKEDGSFETKEERAKRKEAERAKREREKMKDQKREKKKAFSKQLAHLVAEDSGSSCAGASGGLSMYDRVKRRSSAANKDDGTKKTAALQRLRDKNNERKNQKRIRVQLDSSDEEDEGHSSTRKVVDSDVDDSSEEEEEVRVEKTENVDSSEEEETKKKRDWSTDESEESDAGNRKQHKKSIKKTSEKHQKHNKNINMDDVFGADSTDNEKPSATEERDKKRKKPKKESSDENEAPKKKLVKSEKLDFESIFGPDKPQKKSKPAKRQKKGHRSDESSDSEAEPQSISRKVDEADASQPSLKEEKDDQPVVVKHEVTEENLDEGCTAETESMEVVKPEPGLEEENKDSTGQTDTEETTAAPAVAVSTSSAQVPTVSDQSRPKLLTKAAMKIFVPSQSAVATPTVPANQPSTEADSDEDSTDYDDVFAAALSAPSSSQHVVSSTLPARRVSTSSSAATEPDDASDSDSDSQRSRHRAVELVDAAAGYASVKNVDDTISSSDECAGPKEDVSAAIDSSPTHEETSTEKDETEDAVKSIFDGDDEEEEPQYPTLVFVPGKNGAVVASAGLSTASEVAIASASIAVSNDETNRAASAIAHVDDEDEEDADVAPGDVSDEQLLRESFVEEPILEEKPAADKSLETPTSAEERIPPVEQRASNVIVIEDDDEVVEVPCSESSSKEPPPPRTASYQQPITPQVSVPISVAIAVRKAPYLRSCDVYRLC
ncbi:hypothetical protein ANCCEY_01814 [Ancylostoma ceylanicum]|uniref:RRM domain-containing protein n=1 Tax=Ancylostoma ceylanicum TaxID=53326 RepID=A0A0D6M9E3_9BILA|nr:hypothetical protein ANCCEY_01814 [Ancylostoma ceylanicum]